MNTARIKELMQQQQSQQKNLTAADVRNARERMLDAREAIGQSEQAVRDAQQQYSYLPVDKRTYYLDPLYRKVQDAKDDFYTAQKDYEAIASRGAVLEAQEHAQNHQAEREAKEQQSQAAHAAEQEQEAKTAFRQRYIAAGGTSDSFEKAWPDMWLQELARRAMTGQGTLESRLRTSGRYIGL